MTEVEELRERIKHMEIHHADELDNMRVSYNVRLDSIISNLQRSQVAMSRDTPKIHVMEYMVQDSIEIAQKTRALFAKS
jgi:hypothetical protein